MKAYFQLFRRREFRLLAVADGISGMGDQVGWVALLWFVMVSHGHSTDMGLLALCFGLPGVALGTVAGTVLDKCPRKKVLVTANILLGAVFIGIPFLFWEQWLPFWLLLTIVALAGCLTPVTSVGWMVLMPSLVSEDELAAANSITETIYQSSSLLGPLAAGVLITAFGAPMAILADGLSFWLAAWCVSRIGIQTGHRETRLNPTHSARFWRDTWDGVKYLLASKGVLWITVGAVLFNMTFGLLDVSLPLFVHQQLLASALLLGSLWAFYYVSSIVGSLCVGMIRTRHRGGVMACMVIGWGICFIPILLVHSAGWVYVMMSLAGFLFAGYPPMARTAVQERVPSQLQGRIFGIRSSIIAVGVPFGSMIGSFGAQTMYASSVIGMAGIAMALAGVLFLCLPSFRSL